MIGAALPGRRLSPGAPVSGSGRTYRQRLGTLALPPLTEEGGLPPGVHAAALGEVRVRFGIGSARKKTLFLRLEGMYRVAQTTS